MTRRPARLTLQTLEDRWTPAAAGTLGPTFGVGGKQIYPVAGGSAGVVESSGIAQPDGKLVLVGSDATAGFTAVGVNRDGSTDAKKFGSGRSVC